MDIPLLEQKRRIYSSTWDSFILRSSLWTLNPSLGHLNQDRKKGRNSTFDRNLNVVFTLWSTSLRVKTVIPWVFSLNSKDRGEWQVDGWLRKVEEEIVESRWCIESILEGKSGMALNRRRSKRLIFRLFLSVPYTGCPSKWSYDSQNWC